MREIKFRGQAKDGIWFYGDLLTNHPHHGTAILEHGCINNAVVPETVGQFTGLKDRNGKDIYEGDIISLDKNASLYNNCPITVIGVVFYNKGSYDVDTKKVINKKFTNKESIHFATKAMDWIHIPEFGRSEAIGNIYDNPELLNEK